MGLRKTGMFSNLVLLVVVFGFMGSTTALAAGIAVARFGGEHGHPTTDNVTSIYYNPAGLVLNRGTHLFIDGTFATRSVTFLRPASAIGAYTLPDGTQEYLLSDGAEAANSGEATLSNMAAVPFMGLSSDFGTDWMAAGLAFYAPFGGSSSWDKNTELEGNEMYPGAVDGSQRWFSIDGTIRSLYLTAATAFQIEAADLSLGFSVSGIKSDINTVRARNAEGDDQLVASPDDMTLKEGRAHVNAQGMQVGFGLGAIWQPLPDKLWFGFSYTSKPNVSGGMELDGELTTVFGVQKDAETTDVTVTQDMPDIYRFGARLRPTEKLELRMFADYTRWSALEAQCILTKGSEQECTFSGVEDALTNPQGVTSTSAQPPNQAVGRFWQDSYGVRLGGSYWFTDNVETYLGGGYDSSAVPVEMVDPALFDMDKISASIGTRWQALESFGLALTYTHVFYFEVDTDGQGIADEFSEASKLKQPSNEGVYNQSVNVLNFYTDISF